MTAETDILGNIIARLDALERALGEDAALTGTPPKSLVAFEAMSSPQRSGSRALMKSFEQFEDQLARMFRLIPVLLSVETDGWYMKDFANFMEKNGVVEDADEWMVVVQLRNRLVHDYPVAASAQFDKLNAVFGRIPMLIEIKSRLLRLVAEKGFAA